MGFNEINALWLLPLLGLIVLMYILKEEHEEREISSLYLWKSVIADSEVKKPWQKLKNNILMLLQLLAAFLIIMALSNPFIKSGKAVGGNIVIVIDRSGSMSAKSNGKSRLEIAKNMAEKAVVEAPSYSTYTIVSTDKETEIHISNTEDKSEAINRIKNIKHTNIEGNIKNQLSIIKAIYNQLDKGIVLAYTDEPLYLNDLEGQVINLGEEGENLALNSITYSDEGEFYTMLVRVENTGNVPLKGEIALYGEDNLLSLEEVEISAKSIENLYFYNIEKAPRYFYAEIQQEDMLIEDNIAYLVPYNAGIKRALLVSRGNVFIEKALSAVEGIELYKTDNFNIKYDDYDLYIFDGASPKEMPERGSILFINPDTSNEFLNIQDMEHASIAYFVEHGLNRYLEDKKIFISKGKNIDKPYWADALIASEDNVLAGIGINEGKKLAYISFDIHDTNLPLSPEFPIFIYNISSYLTDLEAKGKGFYGSGQVIDIDFSQGIQEMVMRTPSGREEVINENMVAYGFGDTEEIGVYNLLYRKNDIAMSRDFAVNFPVAESRKAFEKWESEDGKAITGGGHKGALDMRTPLMVLVFIILLLEWVVYLGGIKGR